MPEQKLSKAEERNLEEKILQVERPSLLDLLNTKNNSANRVSKEILIFLT